MPSESQQSVSVDAVMRLLRRNLEGPPRLGACVTVNLAGFERALSAIAVTGERSSDESEPLPDCSCAMTEASMWSCPIHGLESSEELLAAWDAAQAAAKSRIEPATGGDTWLTRTSA